MSNHPKNEYSKAGRPKAAKRKSGQEYAVAGEGVSS
jgi:hypothetical protein